jgi:sarcosine oxidase gamma subunit
MRAPMRGTSRPRRNRERARHNAQALGQRRTPVVANACWTGSWTWLRTTNPAAAITIAAAQASKNAFMARLRRRSEGTLHERASRGQLNRRALKSDHWAVFGCAEVEGERLARLYRDPG